MPSDNKLLRKLKSINKGEAVQCCMALAFVAVLVAPLIALAPYSHATLDDFITKWRIDNWYNGANDGLFVGALKFAWESWLQKQGFFWGMFVSGLNPYYLFGSASVPVTNIVSIFILLGTLIFFFRALVFKWFDCKRWSPVLWFVAAAVFLITQFHNPKQTFYFFTTITIYYIPVYTSLVGYGCLLYALQAQGRRRVAWQVFAFICLALGCGGVFATAVANCVIMFAVVLMALVKKHPQRRFLLALGLVVLAFSALAIFAPGNRIFDRLAGEPDVARFSPLTTLLVAAKNSITIYTEDASLGWVALVLLLLVFPAAGVVRQSKHSFKLPLVPLLAALAVLYGGIAVFYAAKPTEEITVRYIAMMRMYEVVMLFALLLYFLAWLYQKHGFLPNSIPVRFQLGVVAVAVGLLAMQLVPINNWTSLRVQTDISNGEPQAYKAQVDTFFEAFESDEKTLVFDRPVPTYEMLEGLGALEVPGSFDYECVSLYFDKELVFELPEGE